MQKFIQYIQEFQDNNEKWLYFVKNILPKVDVEVSDTEVEHILDYLYSNQKVDITKIGYKTIKEKADKWNTKLQTIKVKDDSDWIEIVLDFKDWFKFVKLVSKDSYEKEGKLMSHCVGSYYGRWKDIYSLRDGSNNPHCTIEDGNQIKGKGNWKIDPKYIEYVVKFLEFKGMQVREWEMQNLWYYKLDKIDTNISCEKLYNWYVFEWNLNLIKDKDWNTYQGLWILNVKNLIDFPLDMKFKINLDIKATVAYFINIFKKQNKKDDTVMCDVKHSSQVATSGDYSKVATSGDYSQVATSGHSSQVATSGHSSKVELTGNDSVGANISIRGTIKGTKWSRITLAEYKEERDVISRKWKPLCVRSIQIDWEIIKENTEYTLKNWEFIEVK